MTFPAAIRTLRAAASELRDPQLGQCDRLRLADELDTFERSIGPALLLGLAMVVAFLIWGVWS